MILATMTMNMDQAEEIRLLIPKERARISELIELGAVERLYVAKEGTAAWLIFRSDSLEEVQALVETLPLHSLSTIEMHPVVDPLS